MTHTHSIGKMKTFVNENIHLVDVVQLYISILILQ